MFINSSRLLLAALSALCLFLVQGLNSRSAQAQPSGAMGDNFIYLVESGDTLSELSELYTTRSASWRELQGLNQIPNELDLPIAKALSIPFNMIPVVAAEASISHSKGEVWVNNSAAQREQRLQAGDVIRTGNNGFITLLLEDQSTISLPNNSQLYIKQLNTFERARLIDAILELQQGSVESRVAPDNTGVGRFEINTPVSVTGVRGTNLRVHTTEQMARTELITGKAHLNTSTQTNYQNLLQAQGANIHADGSYAIWPLLPAPALTEPVRGKQGWQTTITPVEGATHYVVQIALAADGTALVRSDEVPAEELTVPLQPSGAGQHYAFIRAVDERGLMGIDAALSFPGQGVLISSDGAPILSSDGQAVLLTDY